MSPDPRVAVVTAQDSYSYGEPQSSYDVVRD
jgi:hypothetical protein